MRASAAVLALVISLAVPACTQLVGNAAAQAPAANTPPLTPPPANYRQLAADFLGTGKNGSVSLKGSQISSLRVAVAPQIGDWVACVSYTGERRGFIAVFFVGDEVINARQEVGIDHCAQATGYRLLPPPKPKKKAYDLGQ